MNYRLIRHILLIIGYVSKENEYFYYMSVNISKKIDVIRSFPNLKAGNITDSLLQQSQKNLWL